MRQEREVFVIAEAGVNHNGSLQRAYDLVDAAKASGADAIKFQTFKAEAVVSAGAPKAEYQITTTGAEETQLDMIRKLELSFEDHRKLQAYCQAREIAFLSTPFDAASADFLIHDLGIATLKVASGEITNAPFLLHLGRLGRPVLLSTGMSTLGDIELALGVLAFGFMGCVEPPCRETFVDAYSSDEGQHVLTEKVSLLHCTTEYPAPFDEVNLRVLDTLRAAFRLPTGYSDHTPGIAIPLAAAALGASVIEKHFTLSRDLPGPDHKASLEPDELADLVQGIRQIEAALGDAHKRPTRVERKNRAIARRSLVAKTAVRAGEIWTTENVTCKRPGTGRSPMEYWTLLGTESPRDYAPDEIIDPDRQIEAL